MLCMVMLNFYIYIKIQETKLLKTSFLMKNETYAIQLNFFPQLL